MAARIRTTRLAISIFMSMLLVSSLNAGAAAAEMDATLKLVATRSKINVDRFGRWVYMDLGAYLAALDAPFELRVTRPVYGEPLVLQQIVHTEDGHVVKPLDGDLLAGWAGLAGFLRLQVTDSSGALIRDRTMDFCPGMSPRERVNDDGPVNSRYPEGCFANPFSTGMVWGIDEGWAASVSGWYEGIRMRLPEGTFDVTLSIAEPFADLFGVDPEDAVVTVQAVVKDAKRRCCHHREGGGSEQARGSATLQMEDPAPGLLPDLRSLPAWGIRLRRQRDGREFLSFGATVWTAGASSLVVEGFRRSDEDVMDAYQYFFDNGEVVGRAPVGTMEFDDRRGHHHWHFLQFAGYSLVDADMIHARRSKKEAFCLAATDAIDMTLPDAEWRPYSLGFDTACGSPGSMWVREVLPLGWGDTYTQGRAGQAFNVTKLPNGVYYIKVEANPGGLLHEQDTENNVEYRKVIIRGKPGARYVKVPLWNGIDSEGHYEHYGRLSHP